MSNYLSVENKGISSRKSLSRLGLCVNGSESQL